MWRVWSVVCGWDRELSRWESAQEHDKSVNEGNSKSAISQHQVKTEHVVISKPVVEGGRMIDNEPRNTQESQGSYSHQASWTHPQQNRMIWPAWPLPTPAGGGWDQGNQERLTCNAFRLIPLPVQSYIYSVWQANWQNISSTLVYLNFTVRDKRIYIWLFLFKYT